MQESDEIGELRARLFHLAKLQATLRAMKLRRQDMRSLTDANLAQDHPRLPRWPSGLVSDFDAVLGGFSGITVIGGTAGAGKSTLALACALENAVTDSGALVVYADAENVAGEIRPRVERWFGGEAPFHAQYLAIAQQRFYWVPVRNGHTFGQIFHVIADWADTSHTRVLVVLDSLQKIARRVDPARNLLTVTAEMYNAFEEAVQESEGAISFLVLSELNKELGLKGGSGLYDSTVALTVMPEEEENVVRIQMLKNRNGRNAGDLGLHEVDWRICRLVKEGYGRLARSDGGESSARGRAH